MMLAKCLRLLHNVLTICKAYAILYSELDKTKTLKQI